MKISLQDSHQLLGYFAVGALTIIAMKSIYLGYAKFVLNNFNTILLVPL